MSKINTYYVSLFTNYLDKLAAIPDGDGSLLDNMTILYGGGISNSTFHAGNNLPVLLLGGGAGWLRGGRTPALPRRADHGGFASEPAVEIRRPHRPTGRQHRAHRDLMCSLPHYSARGKA